MSLISIKKALLILSRVDMNSDLVKLARKLFDFSCGYSGSKKG